MSLGAFTTACLRLLDQKAPTLAAVQGLGPDEGSNRNWQVERIAFSRRDARGAPGREKVEACGPKGVERTQPIVLGIAAIFSRRQSSKFRGQETARHTVHNWSGFSRMRRCPYLSRLRPSDKESLR